MELALIAPTSLLSTFCMTSRVQMCLAHRVLEDEQYRDFYHTASQNGLIVTMDNSLWELGEAMTFDKLMEACKLIGPTELIAPDRFRDGPSTLQMLQEFVDKMHRVFGDGEVPFGGIFAVSHGKDREEWLDCFDRLNDNPFVATIGLPKVLSEIWDPGGRIGCVEFLEATGRIVEGKNYHCLGIWTDPIEVMLLAKHKWIRSLDTALPIHAGMQSIRFDPELGLSRRRPKRPHIYFDATTEQLRDKMADIQYNILTMQQWMNGRHR